MIWMWVTAAAAAVWLCLRSAYERRVFTTDVYELRSEKVTKERTFVFLTDLHDNCFGKGQRRLLAAISRVNPDAVLIGGDMMIVKERAETGAALFFVEKLAGRFPVYYGNGNHENRLERDRGRYGDAYDRYRRRLEGVGVVWLSDGSADLDGEVCISGLNLSRKYYRRRCPDKLEPGYIGKRLGCADRSKYQILLAHSPRFFDDYGKWGADLTLSGHYHGGTIWIPGLGGVITTQFEFFRKECRGLHKRKGSAMIVGRGLGTHSVNLRLNNMAQLVVVKLAPEGDAPRENAGEGDLRSAK